MEAHGQESGGLRVSPLALIACEAALAVAWLLDYLVFRPPFPVSYGGIAPLAPLYAFPIPVFRAQAIVFVGLALLFVFASERLCDPTRVGRKRFAGLLAAAAFLLPLALFLVRQDLGRLGSQFEIYRTDEFLDDARRIDSLPGFLAGYVERMPSLSLHGGHFPPGHAVLLYAVGKAFGFGTLPAGIAVLVCFTIGILVCGSAMLEKCPGRAGRQAALLLLACPAMLEFACTSMDAVFLLFAALALRAGLRAFEPGASIPSAIAAGVLLLFATFFSFSALPLGLVLGLYAAFHGVQEPLKTLARLAWIGAAYVASALSLFGATGFPIWRCLLAARHAGLELMTHAAGADPRSIAPQFWYGNITAISIGAGVAILVALAVRLRVRSLCAEPWTPAVLVTLAAMTFGGMYFMETERVWLFVLPWIALAAVTAGAFEARSLRLLLFAGLAQALAMEIGLFTLW